MKTNANAGVNAGANANAKVEDQNPNQKQKLLTIPMNFEIAYNSAKNRIVQLTQENTELQARLDVMGSYYSELYKLVGELEKQIAALIKAEENKDG